MQEGCTVGAERGRAKLYMIFKADIIFSTSGPTQWPASLSLQLASVRMALHAGTTTPIDTRPGEGCTHEPGPSLARVQGVTRYRSAAKNRAACHTRSRGKGHQQGMPVRAGLGPRIIGKTVQTSQVSLHQAAGQPHPLPSERLTSGGACHSRRQLVTAGLHVGVPVRATPPLPTHVTSTKESKGALRRLHTQADCAAPGAPVSIRPQSASRITER